MSKKKMPRAAMTLKDFHGGSIPSDLPLPSAPGMTVDRSVFERQSSSPWMSPTLGRGFGGDRGGYNRPGTANGSRTFEEKASYFPNPANIGRNYDEDERKPVDNRPRSNHSAERYDDHDRYEDRRSGYDKPLDRYAHDDQAGFEPRSLASSDRFSRTQQSRPLETDNYVQEDFGLIPVGPPRMPQRDLQLTSNLTSEKLQVLPQDTLASAPTEQASFKYTQQPSGLSYSSPYVTSPPPRSWRTNAQQHPAPLAVSRSGPDPASNVWTARREGDINRGPNSDSLSSEVVGSTLWRNQRMLEASAVDRVFSGRWQSDRRQVAEQSKEGPTRPSGHGSGFSSDGARPPVPLEAPPFLSSGHAAAEPGRSGYSSDQGRGPYSEVARANYDDSGRARYGEGRGRGLVNSNRGEHSSSDGRGYPDGGHGTFDAPARERGDSRVGYHDFSRGGYSPDIGRASYPLEDGHRGYPEDRWSAGGVPYIEADRVVESDRGPYVDSGRSHPEAGRIGFDSGRLMYPDGGRGAYGDVTNNGDMSRDSGYPERAPYFDSGRGYGVPGRSGYAERNNYDSYGSDSADSGRQVYGVETVRDNYLPNVGRGPHGSESPRPGYLADRDRGGSLDNSRAVSSGDRERGGGSFGRSRSPDIQASGGDSTRPPLSAVTVSAEPAQIGLAGRPDPAERPKLKLLPRSRPLEKPMESTAEVTGQEEMAKDSRLPTTDRKTGDAVQGEPLVQDNTPGEVSSLVGHADNTDDGIRLSERPKLNLKPRSRPGESAAEDRSEKHRNSVFGGARPREFILKERGGEDAVVTSVETVVSSGRSEILRVEKQEYWGEERRYDGRSLDRQGTNRLTERQDSNRPERQEGRKDPDRKEGYYKKDGRKDGERQDSGRRELDRFDSRRDQDRSESRREDKQERNRDIDKQESWRRPADPPAPVSPALGSRNIPPTGPALVDSAGSHSGGRFGSAAPATAVELAQAFSRSASLGSSGGVVRGNQRQVPSPLARSPGHGFGYLNGSSGPYGGSPKDAPFSRLAEGPGPAQNRDGFGISGPIYGGDRQNNGHVSGKSGNFGPGSNDPSRSSSFNRYESGPGQEIRDWNDGGEEFPGRRGLPIRRNYD